MNKPQEKEDHAREQAKAQLQSVRNLVAAFETAVANGDSEAAEQAIHEDALSVEYRTGWQVPGRNDKPDWAEYRIVLCTGGPHVEIYGELNKYNEPENAFLRYQDWFTGFTVYPTDAKEDDDLLTYARRFYFGEG